MKCWLCLRVYDGLGQLNQHVRKDHPLGLNEEQTYAKVIVVYGSIAVHTNSGIL
jgi:hypothetical protein